MFYNERLMHFASYHLQGKPVPNSDWVARLMFKDFNTLDELKDETTRDRKRMLKDLARFKEDAKLIEETGYDSLGERHLRLHESVSATPNVDHSAYKVTDTYLEMRTPFDEKRGIVTLGFIGFLAAPVGVGLPDIFGRIIPSFISGTLASGATLSPMGYVSGSFAICLAMAWIGAAIVYGHPILRLENLVQRRLLVRFNRKTQKVYVHRPAYVGGIVELDWKRVSVAMVDPDREESLAMGVPMMLMWPPDATPSGVMEMVMPGRLARGNSELTNRWEYIRRYMESDPSEPHGLPEPNTVGKIPWPWKSIGAALSLVWPLFKIRALWFLIPLLVLIAPVMLLYAFGHFASHWLCWEPRWPKAIEQACGDGLVERLKLIGIDLVTWGMGAATIWALWRYL